MTPGAVLGPTSTIILRDGGLPEYGVTKAPILMDGEITLTAGARDGGLVGTLQGTASSVVAGNKAVQLQGASVTEAPALSGWSYAVVVVFISVVAALAVHLHAVRQGRTLLGPNLGVTWPRASSVYWASQAEWLADTGPIRLARVCAWLAGRLQPRGTEAIAAHARVEWARGAYASQVRDHAVLDDLLSAPAEVAANAIMAARALVCLGQPDKALEQLRVADHADPNLVAQHLRGPGFAMVRDTQWVRMKLAESSWVTPGYT